MTGWFALALIVAVVLATAAIFAAGRKAGAAGPTTEDVRQLVCALIPVTDMDSALT